MNELIAWLNEQIRERRLHGVEHGLRLAFGGRGRGNVQVFDRLLRVQNFDIG